MSEWHEADLRRAPHHVEQDVATLVLTGPAILSGLLGEVVENDTRLAQSHVAAHKDRRLAHDVDLAIVGRAGFAGEKGDPVRAPVGAGQFQHQRHLVGVAGFRKAVQRELGHLYRLLAISSFMISLVPP